MKISFEQRIREIFGPRNIKLTAEPAVFVIRRGIFSDIFKGIQTKKNMLVDELSHNHRYVYFWLNSWTADLVKEAEALGCEKITQNLWAVKEPRTAKDLV